MADFLAQHAPKTRPVHLACKSLQTSAPGAGRTLPCRSLGTESDTAPFSSCITGPGREARPPRNRRSGTSSSTCSALSGGWWPFAHPSACMVHHKAPGVALREVAPLDEDRNYLCSMPLL